MASYSNEEHFIGKLFAGVKFLNARILNLHSSKLNKFNTTTFRVQI